MSKWVCSCGKEAIMHLTWKGNHIYLCNDCIFIWEDAGEEEKTRLAIKKRKKNKLKVARI